jgi:hypothetical protein
VKLNRKTQPVVYRRVAIKTSILEDERRRDALFGDIAILCLGLMLTVLLFAVLG